MAIRLAALDVDGTLLAPDNSITPATRQAIREAKDAGLEIVVCTGRSFVEVQDILRQLPEVRYLSCGTGAYALDVWTMARRHIARSRRRTAWCIFTRDFPCGTRAGAWTISRTIWKRRCGR